jgi:hypothetical protein
MRFGKTTIAMITILILCCACDNWQAVTPNNPVPTITMTAGEDFDCWTAGLSNTSEGAKPDNVLIFSYSFEEKKTSLFSFSLSKETTESEVAFPRELDYMGVSPNGQYVSYQNEIESSDLYIYDRVKRTHQKIPNFADVRYTWDRWSNDSQCLLIRTAKKEFAYRVADNAVQGKDRTGALEESMVWWATESPDGKFAAWECKGHDQICLIDAEGQRIDHPALTGSIREDRYPSMVLFGGWSADSRIFVFSFCGPGGVKGYTNTLRLVFMDENGVQGYEDLNYTIINGISWAPDRERILIKAGTLEFYLYDLSTGESTQFATPGNGVHYVGAVNWFPDGKQIIFIGESGQSLYRMNLDGTEFVKLPVAVEGTMEHIFLIP